jgi:hypothetical protein
LSANKKENILEWSSGRFLLRCLLEIYAELFNLLLAVGELS